MKIVIYYANRLLFVRCERAGGSNGIAVVVVVLRTQSIHQFYKFVDVD